MATKKKKSDSITLEMPGTLGSAKVVLPKEKKTKLKNVDSGGWPKMQQGSHLTVKTFEDGRTELIWDDEALLNDVRAAILKAESATPVSSETKSKRTKKDASMITASKKSKTK
jgi:hypothetical protein